jgi:hypothetical protein
MVATATAGIFILAGIVIMGFRIHETWKKTSITAKWKTHSREYDRISQVLNCVSPNSPPE